MDLVAEPAQLGSLMTEFPKNTIKKPRVPNIDTLADLIDRLIVEVHKLAFFENAKRQEHAKTIPDDHTIARLDNASRDCCELRSLIKSEINSLLGEIVRTGEYNVMREVRTFRPAGKTIADILADMCYASANKTLKGDLAEALQETLA